MVFRELFKDNEAGYTPSLVESNITPEDLLRAHNFKIKTIFTTKFGTEFLMFKKFDSAEIERVLKDFNIKISGLSIFVEII